MLLRSSPRRLVFHHPSSSVVRRHQHQHRGDNVVFGVASSQLVDGRRFFPATTSAAATAAVAASARQQQSSTTTTTTTVAESLIEAILDLDEEASSSSTTTDKNRIDRQQNPRLFNVVTAAHGLFRMRNPGGPAATKVFQAIDENIGSIPVIVLARLLSRRWPHEALSHQQRLRLRREVFQRVGELTSGTEIARVIELWSMKRDHEADLGMFKKLGHIFEHRIATVRSPIVVLQVLRAFRRARIKPAAGFLSNMARHFVACAERRREVGIGGENNSVAEGGGGGEAEEDRASFAAEKQVNKDLTATPEEAAVGSPSQPGINNATITIKARGSTPHHVPAPALLRLKSKDCIVALRLFGPTLPRFLAEILIGTVASNVENRAMMTKAKMLGGGAQKNNNSRNINDITLVENAALRHVVLRESLSPMAVAYLLTVISKLNLHFSLAAPFGAVLNAFADKMPINGFLRIFASPKNVGGVGASTLDVVMAASNNTMSRRTKPTAEAQEQQQDLPPVGAAPSAIVRRLVRDVKTIRGWENLINASALIVKFMERQNKVESESQFVKDLKLINNTKNENEEGTNKEQGQESNSNDHAAPEAETNTPSSHHQTKNNSTATSCNTAPFFSEVARRLAGFDPAAAAADDDNSTSLAHRSSRGQQHRAPSSWQSVLLTRYTQRAADSQSGAAAHNEIATILHTQLLPTVLRRYHTLLNLGVVPLHHFDQLMETVSLARKSSGGEQSLQLLDTTLDKLKDLRREIETSDQPYKHRAAGGPTLAQVLLFNERHDLSLINNLLPSSSSPSATTKALVPSVLALKKLVRAFTRRELLGRHPLTLVKMLETCETAFPKMLQPAMKREFAFAIERQLMWIARDKGDVASPSSSAASDSASAGDTSATTERTKEDDGDGDGDGGGGEKKCTKTKFVPKINKFENKESLRDFVEVFWRAAPTQASKTSTRLWGDVETIAKSLGDDALAKKAKQIVNVLNRM